jgi:MSHA biogenesis protein MshN
MSLVNQMLQDLDRRRALVVETGTLSAQARALPARRRELPWKSIAVALVGLVSGAAALGWWAKPHPAGIPSETAISGADRASRPESVSGPADRKTPAVPGDPAVRSADTPTADRGRGNSSADRPPIVASAPASVGTAAWPVPARPAKVGTHAAEPPPAGTTVPGSAPVAANASRPSEPAKREAPVAAEPPAAVMPETSAKAEPSGAGTQTNLPAQAQLATAPPAVPAKPEPARIEKRPRPPSARERADQAYRQAVTSTNQGRIGQAMDELRAALREDPGHLPARRMLAAELTERGEVSEAVEVLREGLAADPAQPALAVALARLQAERGDHQGALATLEASARAGAGDAELRGLHAAILQRVGRHQEAVEEYRAALRLLPGAGVWRIGLGISLEELGRDAEARQAFLQARAAGGLSAPLAAFVERKLAP